MEYSLLTAVLALIFLTVIVWIRMYYIRYVEVKKAGLSIDDLKPENAKNIPVKFLLSGDNFRNLFELPILFYMLVIFITYLDRVDDLFINLGWIFVISRYIHSFIHTTYNKVKHRFIIYILGAFILWFMWIRFAWIYFS